MDARAPIGVFDSGVGGLTVLRALRAALPWREFHL
ncbi:MAG: glutamate racemase, partial [Gammaproteobacteria bacterium]|nr:glutamate racemase [Gammaproteobacteria bacterium]